MGVRIPPVDWSTDDLPDQTGRTVVVTGATSGLGLLLTRRLSEAGATVIMAVRNPDKAERVRAGLTGAVEIAPVDTADLDSVRHFATALGARSIDVLINNAGVANQPYRLSPQGFESQFATNYLGHVALTRLLLPNLSAGTEPRIVAVGSNLYTKVKITFDFDDLVPHRPEPRRYSPGMTYTRSKVATMLFAEELRRRLTAAGSDVQSLLAHPGMASTPMQDHLNGCQDRVLVTIMKAVFARPAEQGVKPLLYAAVGPDVPTGRSIGPVGSRRDSQVGFADFAAPVTDVGLARRVWERTEEITGVRSLL